MKKQSSRMTWCWLSVVIGLGMSGAIGLSMLPTNAQSVIVPDETLGAERSRVIPVSTIDFDIAGGAKRGVNLFHSFREFNVPNRGSVYFISPVGVQNIFSRITGSNSSNILGILGTYQSVNNNGSLVPSNANLFLINPNGIVFGRNASLDVGGSFSATTANAIQFGDQGSFSATNPGNGLPLLTINPSAYLFNQVPMGNILNQSRADDLNDPSIAVGLRVLDGQNLTLLGGNVALEGGLLSAFGGRVELGAVAAVGRVEILPTGALAAVVGTERGNVVLTSGAQVDVRLDSGGEIGITSKDIQLTGGSRLVAGIFSGLGTTTSRAGDIRLDATGTVRIEKASQIENNVNTRAIGRGGNVQIGANTLQVTEGAQLSSSTSGTGDAGNIVINVRDHVTFDGNQTGVFSTVNKNGTGKGGDIRISANSLDVSNGGELIASTAGKGDAGNVLIMGDRVVFNGRNTNGAFPSGAFSTVDQGAIGNGGDIRISANSLEVSNGAGLNANTAGKGNAGNVLINVRDRVLFQNGSVALSNVEPTGMGKGGNVEISSGGLEVRDHAALIASTAGRGDAGNVVINVRDHVLFQNRSVAFSSVEATGTGNGGNVEISSGGLEVRNGSGFTARTEGQGDAGDIKITARDGVLFQGTNTSAFSSVGKTGQGQGGNVEISSGSLEVRDGAQLIADTEGVGDAGDVKITVRDRVLFQNGDALSDVTETGIGQGGNVIITSSNLEVRGGAQLIASTTGQGDAGNVWITARDSVFLDGTNPDDGRSSAILTNNGTPKVSASRGAAGSVLLTSSKLTLSNGAVINARTTNDRPGGNITLTLSQLNLLSGGQIYTTSEDSGSAGTITLTATDQIHISGSDPTLATRIAQNGTRVSPISASSGLYVRSSSTGSAGNIVLTTPYLTLDQQGRIDAQSATVSGGNISLSVPKLLVLRNGSQISATAGTASPQAPGDGGNISINARFIIAIPKENSDITANATQGRGGGVAINSQGVFGLKVQLKLTPLSDITASSEVGLSGTINFNAPDTTYLQNSLTEFSQTFTDTTQLLANSCIVRSRKQNGRFVITGSGGLPLRPSDAPLSPFPTGEVGVSEVRGEGEGVRGEEGQGEQGRQGKQGKQEEERGETYVIQNSTLGTQNSPDRPWKIGDPIVEPQGVYKLANGDLVMSRECSNP